MPCVATSISMAWLLEHSFRILRLQSHSINSEVLFYSLQLPVQDLLRAGRP